MIPRGQEAIHNLMSNLATVKFLLIYLLYRSYILQANNSSGLMTHNMNFELEKNRDTRHLTALYMT